jgi:ubiquinone/menaquinone biosynthesis C-methylase UbiE
MLNVVRKKSRSEDLPIQCLKANLVQLAAVADESVDAAISLFSTLGMIRGRENRQQALHHAFRILKPKCPFVVHVHNYWYNLYDPSGPWWVLGNLARAAFSTQIEVGDKYFDYRGVPNMFLHVFRHGELRQSLLTAGFRVQKIIPLDRRRNRSLRCPWLLGRLRANGWIAVAERPG